jgi:acetylornithine deacetylase/succinyl-diaminopimelate desuccinylase-like protein
VDFIQASERILSIDSSPSVGNGFVVDYAQDVARELGLKTEIATTIIDGVEQKLIFIRRGEPAPNEVILWSSLDTLDPGSYSQWQETDHNPFLSTIKGEKIYGLGSATGKLDFLIKMQALKDFSKNPQTLSPVLVGSFGKEENFSGARYFLSQYKRKIHGVIVGEPTDLQIVNQFSGSVIIQMELLFTEEEIVLRKKAVDEDITSTQTKIFRGRSCHASTPQFGKSAFLELKNYVEKLPSNTLLLSMESGTSPYIIPEEAILELDVGLAGIDSLRERFLVFLQKIDEVFHNRFTKYARRYDLKDFPPYNIGYVRTTEKGLELEGTFFLTDGVTKERVKDWIRSIESPNVKLSLTAFKASSRMQEDHALIQDFQSVLQVHKLSEALQWRHKVSDASYFQTKGIPAIAFGAGAIAGSSYLPNEYNILTQLQASKKLYIELLERICK